MEKKLTIFNIAKVRLRRYGRGQYWVQDIKAEIID